MTDESRGGGPFGLFRAIPDALSRVIRHQIDAAKAELARRWIEVRPGVVLVAVGAVLVLAGVGALIASAITGLAQVLPPWLSALLVGVVLVAAAGLLIAIGVGRLRQGPRRSPPQ